MPVSIAIEPNNSCNLKCPECPAGQKSFSRPAGMVDLEAYKAYLNQVSRHLSYLTLYFQGEPYLHSDIFEMIRYAGERNIYTSISTNAHYLNEDNIKKTLSSGLNRLIISLDGADSEAYSAYRVGGDFKEVIQGVAGLTKMKKESGSSFPFVILQCLVLKSNEQQVDKIRELGKSLMVDKVEFKTAQFYDYHNGNRLMPEDDNSSRYRKGENGKYIIKSNFPRHCWRMWNAAVITWDGRILPCCFDKDAGQQLGSLEENGFKKVWKGKPYNAFRQAILSGREEIDICRNCSEGLNSAASFRRS
jgi:radical SAM protein with 4Fe4S-binding SPASM domain